MRFLVITAQETFRVTLLTLKIVSNIYLMRLPVSACYVLYTTWNTEKLIKNSKENILKTLIIFSKMCQNNHVTEAFGCKRTFFFSTQTYQKLINDVTIHVIEPLNRNKTPARVKHFMERG